MLSVIARQVYLCVAAVDYQSDGEVANTKCLNKTVSANVGDVRLTGYVSTNATSGYSQNQCHCMKVKIARSIDGGDDMNTKTSGKNCYCGCNYLPMTMHSDIGFVYEILHCCRTTDNFAIDCDRPD